MPILQTSQVKVRDDKTQVSAGRKSLPMPINNHLKTKKKVDYGAFAATMTPGNFDDEFDDYD